MFLYQIETPLCPEHVPFRFLLKLYVPSLHLELAPFGTTMAFIGDLTCCPLLFVYTDAAEAGVAMSTAARRVVINIDFIKQVYSCFVKRKTAPEDQWRFSWERQCRQ